MMNRNTTPQENSSLTVPHKQHNAISKSSSSEETTEKTEKLKSCCRTFVELMFTQVNICNKKWAKLKILKIPMQRSMIIVSRRK